MIDPQFSVRDSIETHVSHWGEEPEQVGGRRLWEAKSWGSQERPQSGSPLSRPRAGVSPSPQDHSKPMR